MSARSLRIGTRASDLALWQARHVQGLLGERGIDAELVEITTTGDRILDVPLADIGDKALFTKELDLALLDRRIDLAVHSLKDLPTTLPHGITLAAVPRREDPSDAFVAHPTFGGNMEDLPEGSVVATSSMRRRALLRAWRSDIDVVPVRGNVNTRLRKLDDGSWQGMILASAGLIRLGMEARIRDRIPFDVMLPAVSQGMLGIVCRNDADGIRQMLEDAAHHEPTYRCALAERGFLRTLEGGCSVPVGAFARFEGDVLAITGSVASLDGSVHLRDELSGDPQHAESLGVTLAGRMLEHGAAPILDAIRSTRAQP